MAVAPLNDHATPNPISAIVADLPVDPDIESLLASIVYR
jgi:hypothetical protein